ncbi:MAG: hypothetical protein JWM98_581 [Thermoleophilia bacterium]|nr:hypothetical protein [Thermoleophilia bacterium]
MDELQQRRIAVNESRFRDANQQIAAAVEEFRGSEGDGRFEVMCECAIADCEQMIELGFDEYRHVRSSPIWHVTLPDHVIVAAEDPIERHETYWIIQKRGIGAEITERLS